MNEKTVDEYILEFPIDKQQKLQEIRSLIKHVVPQAQEVISWGMPTYKLRGNLVHFAMAKTHLGFYPGENGVKAFIPQLTKYKYSKGAIQFPLHKPLPKQLIVDIIQFRIKENMENSNDN